MHEKFRTKLHKEIYEMITADTVDVDTPNYIISAVIDKLRKVQVEETLISEFVDSKILDEDGLYYSSINDMCMYLNQYD